MSSRMRSSKYRHVYGTAYKAEEWWVEVQVESGEGDGVAGSSTHVAVASGRAISLLQVGQVGKASTQATLLHGHSSQVQSLAFSAFPTSSSSPSSPPSSLLASTSDDCTVRIWQPTSTSSSSSSSPTASPTASASASASASACVMSLQHHRKRTTSVAWHPSASHVLASASLDASIALWDVSCGQPSLVVAAPSASPTSNGSAWSDVAWSSDGGLLAGVQGSRLAVLDPRSASLALEAPSHAGNKTQRVAWLSGLQRIVSTGFSKHRDRQVWVWDARRLGEPLKKTNVDCSTGPLQPLYDADSQLLFVSGRGDNSVRVYDMQESSPHLSQITSFSQAPPSKGMAMAPKLSVRSMDCEVVRLLKLTASSVVPIGFCVPRKSKRVFHADLFPPTNGPEPALTASQFFAGQTASPVKVSLDPEHLAVVEEAGGFQKAEEALAERQRQEAEAAERQRLEDEARREAENALPKLNIVRSSKFRHIAGTLANKSEFFTNLKPDNSFSTETEVIKCSERFCAVPWAGSNGQVAVFAVDQPRRFPAAPAVVECGAVQLDLDWHPFEADVLATGLDDSTVKLWRVSDDLLDAKANLTQPIGVLRGHRAKVSITKFHPVANDVLATASYDLSVKLWDVGRQEERLTIACHPEPVLSLAFDYRGVRMVTSCKDRQLRIVDVRSAEVAAETEGHAGAKPSRVTWLGQREKVLSVGFGRNSERQFSVWDTRNFSQALSTTAIDNLSGVINPIYDEGTGVVYLAGKGDGTVSYYEITDDEPHAHLLSKFVTPVPQMGLAVLPKRTCDVRKVQLLRCLKLTTKEVQPLTFSVPRTRRSFFQDDLYPECPSGKPALSAEEFFAGKDSEPAMMSMQPDGMTKLSEAPVVKRVSKYNFKEEVNKGSTGGGVTKEHVMDKFYSKITDSWKEDDVKKEADKEADVDDDEWGDDGWDD